MSVSREMLEALGVLPPSPFTVKAALAVALALWGHDTKQGGAAVAWCGCWWCGALLKAERVDEREFGEAGA